MIIWFSLKKTRKTRMIYFVGTSCEERCRWIWITISVLISAPLHTGTGDGKKGLFFLLFQKKKKKVQKQKGFVDAKISPCLPLLLSLSTCSVCFPLPPYLQTHYTRFVLKTVQFIGAGLLILFLRRLFYYLKESRCGPQDKSDLWLAQGTLWSLRSLITATPGAALSSGAPAITHANPLLCPRSLTATAYLYVLYVSRGGFYKSADGNGVLWRSH